MRLARLSPTPAKPEFEACKIPEKMNPAFQIRGLPD
jgi:hypothetical protein